MQKRLLAPLSLIVLGVGNVGRAFLKQVIQTRLPLRERYGVMLQPAAVADSRGALLNGEGLSPEVVQAALSTKERGQSLAAQPGALLGVTATDLIRRAREGGITRAIVIDTTAAEGMEAALSAALEQGYGVVLANKRPLAGPWPRAQRFFDHPNVRFEATVGAGLPMIAALRYLIDTGDAVQRIEGALSDTLGYLCSRLEDGEPFSEIVSTARARGYTEPDPRDDLSGTDVARKALILGRLAGWPLEMSDLQVDPLYPASAARMSVEEFVASLPQLDADFAAYVGALAGVPRYMAEIGPRGGVVSLRMVGERRAAQLRGTLNQVAFWTQRYAEMPLSLSGPGGGVESAAAAVLQDCLQLALSAVSN
jgi:homoserine dehydrogenase